MALTCSATSHHPQMVSQQTHQGPQPPPPLTAPQQPHLCIVCPRWRAGKFQEVVEAEYVLLEVNGLFTYTYSLTADMALCGSQPQNWTTIAKTAGDKGPFAWDREVGPAF